MNASASDPENMLIVGLGASAGGVEALKLFFASLPEETGMAFIVIMHLAPDRKSSLAELLQQKTSLSVTQVNKRVDIKPDHVYVIPPNKLLVVGDHHLELSEPKNDVEGPAAIDLFFRSLAATKERHSACIVFSGSGTDGALGLKAVKEKGGLTLVQEPMEASYSGMPTHAINTGLVDKIVPVAEMGKELLSYKENLKKIRLDETVDGEDEVLRDILKILNSKTGHDFSNYKKTSVVRRVERRMQVTHNASLTAYNEFLQEHPEEIEELFKDLLISVTSFFRDPEAFEALGEQVIPQLFEGKGPDDHLRIWVPGCATGEEAYSIAILLHEYAQEIEAPPEVHIFASDIDEAALDLGRRGRYPQSIAADINKKRLRRYFDKKDHIYLLKPEIRDMVLFASHNLLRDPPFSKIDLISCRNLFIYLNRDFQSEVFKLMHYSLQSGGWLFLGKSDSNLEAMELFGSVDKENRIYRRSSTSSSNHLPKLPLQFDKNQLRSQQQRKSGKSVPSNEQLHQKLLVRMYAPQSVIVNEKYEILHATDGIQVYLEYSGGEPSRKILDMVKPDLRQALRSLLFQTEKKDSTGDHKRISQKLEKNGKRVEIEVHRIWEPDFPEGLIQIAFHELKSEKKTEGSKNWYETADSTGADAEFIETLEQELQQTKEELQVTIEEYETSNEELRSSNEELQSMNEELQSTTEELETSQEELQSVNEELKTVNQELENKVEKLDRANSDLKNLMEATEVGILFVDRSLCVQRFTEKVTDIFNLISSDNGRPIEHVTHMLKYDTLQEDLTYVLDRLEKIKKIVTTRDNRWYIMRIRPYRSTEDKIEGVVLTFTEITQLKEAEEQLKQQRQQESLATLGMYAISENDLTSIMHRAVQQLCLALDLKYVALFILDEKKDKLKLKAHTGWSVGNEEEAEFRDDQQWDTGFAVRNEKPIVITDYDKEERFRINPLLQEKSIKSGVILKIKESENICGVLGGYSETSRQFTDHELTFLQVIANLLGMSSERIKARKGLEETNRKLQEEIRRSEKYQKEILHNSIVERWNLGGYLHDNLAHLLVAMKITITDIRSRLEGTDKDIASDLTGMLENIDKGISDIRKLTHEIIPLDIETEGVAHSLKLLLRQLQKTHKVHCHLKTGDIIEKIKDRKVATNLYHIIQEAVKNAALHGKANHIDIEIDQKDSHLQLKITDDGIGYKEVKKEKNGGGSGLNIMKHRMELLGGSFKIQDAPNDGTRVLCALPLEKLKQKKE